MEIVLAGSIFLVFFAYFGYPFSLLLLTLVRRNEVRKGPFWPDVTMIITGYNEEKRIPEKLENTLALDYPSDKLQVLVASDGSTDRTHPIVLGYEPKGVELLALKERKGKENAQKEALKHARGEIIVFSDVATRLDPDGISRIVANFHDASVGCVSSEDVVIGPDGKPTGEGFYVRYEMWLRRLESRVRSLVGLSGSLFAARREVCRDFSDEMPSDFRTVLNSMRLGLRGVSDPEVIGRYPDLADRQREFDRKVRTVLRGLTVFFRHLEFLNPFRYGLFAYQYASHKLMRWLVPLFLVTGLASNFFLVSTSPFYLFLFACQVLFYGVGLRVWKSGKPSANLLGKLSMYFLTVNTSIAVAWWRYLRGDRMTMWTPSER